MSFDIASSWHAIVTQVSKELGQIGSSYDSFYGEGLSGGRIASTWGFPMSAFNGKEVFCKAVLIDKEFYGDATIQFWLGKVKTGLYTDDISALPSRVTPMKVFNDANGDLCVKYNSGFTNAEDAKDFVTFAFNKLFSGDTFELLKRILLNAGPPTSPIPPSSSSSNNNRSTNTTRPANVSQSSNPTRPTYTSRPTAPSKPSKAKDDVSTVDLILCLFLGYLGVHKFFRKKIGMGIFYLFTLGGLGFGVLFDLIMIIKRLGDKEYLS